MKPSWRFFVAGLLLTASFADCMSQDKSELIHPEFILHYTGTINGKYKLQMNISVADGEVTGTYRYFTQKSGLYLKGTYNPSTGAMTLQERADAKVTGTFEGILKGQSLAGTWFNADRSKSYPFALTTAEQPLNVSFTVAYKKEDDFVTTNTITIRTKNGGAVLQTLVVPENQIRGEQPSLYLEDMNFDGYPDLAIVLENMSANIPMAYWFYDPGNGIFTENKECSGIGGAQVDLQHRQLTSYASGGCCWHEIANYVYQDGHYFKVYSEVDAVDQDQVERKTVKRWRVENGTTVEVK